VEYRTVTKDGRVVWLRDHAVLVRGEHGEPDYWQGYYIDITEQKQAEEALRQALERERQAARQLRALDEMKNTSWTPSRTSCGPCWRPSSASPSPSSGPAPA
jgi:Neuraminidase (sialidase)